MSLREARKQQKPARIEDSGSKVILGSKRGWKAVREAERENERIEHLDRFRQGKESKAELASSRTSSNERG